MISFCIPSIRPGGFNLLAESIKIHVKADVVKHDIEIIKDDTLGISCGQALKNIVAVAGGEYICFLGDDCLVTSSTIPEALKVMATFSGGVGMVGFNDTFTDGNNVGSHWIAHRDLLPMLDGEFFSTAYRHSFVDNEMTDRCMALGLYKWADDAVILHDHPSFKGGDITDPSYGRSFGTTYWMDQAKYQSRKRNGWIESNEFGKVAVASRLSNIEPSFFTSWTRLITHGLRPGDAVLRCPVRIPHAIAANIIAKQFLKSNADSLLFIDDDQEFRVNALEHLRQTAGFDMVIGMICARRGFSPVALTYNKITDRYTPVESFDGPREVDGIGLGFTLIKRSVIEAVMARTESGGPFSWHGTKGEDVRFCEDAKALGFKVGINPDVDIGHVVQMTLRWSHGKNGPEVFTSEDLGEFGKAELTKLEK